MRRPETNVFRWVIVTLLVLISAFGVPAILSFAQPKRERDDTAIVLMAGEEVPRI
jgi:hypothetical protein